MSVQEIIVGVVGALVGLGELVMLPVVWRGWFSRRETRFRGRLISHGDAAFMFWGGPIVRRGLARAFVPVMLAWCGGVVGYWVAALNGGAAGARAPQAAKVAAVVTAVWFGVWLVVAAPVVLLNRPKLLVPPSQRGEPGAFAEWQSARRKRSQRRPRPRASAHR